MCDTCMFLTLSLLRLRCKFFEPFSFFPSFFSILVSDLLIFNYTPLAVMPFSELGLNYRSILWTKVLTIIGVIITPGIKYWSEYKQFILSPHQPCAHRASHTWEVLCLAAGVTINTNEEILRTGTGVAKVKAVKQGSVKMFDWGLSKCY